MDDLIFLEVSREHVAEEISVSTGWGGQSEVGLQRMVFEACHGRRHLLCHLVDMKLLVFEVVAVLQTDVRIQRNMMTTDKPADKGVLS